jgi:hypothetical protein
MTHIALDHFNRGALLLPSALRPGLSLNRLEAALVGLLCTSLLASTGCAKDSAPGGGASAAAPRARVPVLDLNADVPWPADYARDPLWLRAAAGDDIDHGRLARRENARSLIDAAALGGSLARTALAALPYASDRREVRNALCALLERAETASRGLLIETLYEVVMYAPAVADEAEASKEARGCNEVLGDAVRNDLPDPAVRDRAVVVLSRLARDP